MDAVVMARMISAAGKPREEKNPATSLRQVEDIDDKN